MNKGPAGPFFVEFEMDSITIKKEQSIRQEGFDQSGVVLVNPENGRRAIVEMGAVRWLNKVEFSSLMHPNEGFLLVEHDGITHKLRECPWCSSGGETMIRPLGRMWIGMKYSEPTSFEIIHHCTPTPGQPSRPIVRVGRDLESVLAAWNTRSRA